MRDAPAACRSRSSKRRCGARWNAKVRTEIRRLELTLKIFHCSVFLFLPSARTLIGQAETEATAIRTRAAAVAKAAEMTANVPHARMLQILDKQVEIARAWSNGRATTLVLGSGLPGTGGGSGDMGAGPRGQSMPFATISELAGGIVGPNAGAGSSAAAAAGSGPSQSPSAQQQQQQGQFSNIYAQQ